MPIKVLAVDDIRTIQVIVIKPFKMEFFMLGGGRVVEWRARRGRDLSEVALVFRGDNGIHVENAS